MLLASLSLACVLSLAPAAPLPATPIATPAAGTEPLYAVIKDDRGVWWFQHKDGRRFYSLGVNNVTPEPYSPKPGTQYYNPVPTEFKGDLKSWAAATRKLLAENGFNTLGAWSSTDVPSDPTFVTTPVLYVVQHEGPRCLTPLRPDFESFVRQNVAEAITKLPPREGILGVFLDNEMAWFGKSGWDDIPTYTLLEVAMELPQEDQRRHAAVEFLKQRHGSAEKLAAAYHRAIPDWDSLTANVLRGCSSPEAMADREAFTKLLAERFFETTTRVVREMIPATLILGTRFPGNAPESVIRACGKWCDVVSVNEYRFEPTVDEHSLSKFWLLGGRPLMHTEYSWRAKENASGNPNTRGAGAIVATQAERGKSYASMVSDIATVPYVIGSHWFEFADQSPQGRFDGEDSNYGIVDIHNKPYADLLSSMKSTNARVHDLHASTTRKMPTELSSPRRVTYQPGQHPERPSTLDLLGPWTREPEIWGAPDARLSWSMEGTSLKLAYDAGAQYGAGINIFGPKASLLAQGPDHATDLDGYAAFEVVFDAPEGVQLNLVLAEAGAAPPATPQFDTRGGDDGEAFISAPFYGTGKRQTQRISIGDLTRQPFFGNQRGKGRIDMQSIRNYGIQVQGEPRTGTVTVYSTSLVR